MGVSSTTNTEIYTGDGTTVSFNFPFYFFFARDLYTYIYDTIALTIAQKTLGADFTVVGTPNAQGLYPSGANVVFGVAPSATQQVIISRTPLELQNYALGVNGQISSVPLVQEFDYVVLLIQSLQDQINRCLQLPPGYGPAFSPDLPASLPANYLVGINPTGNGLVATAGSPGPAGPTGPVGPAGAAGMTVVPITSTTALVASSPVSQAYYAGDATGGAFNANLPAASAGVVGQIFVVKKLDPSGNAITINANGTDKILTTTLVGTVSLAYQGDGYTLVCRAAGVWDAI